MAAATDEGVWIGVDWGTTNSAVAVYDRTRGGSKWMRLHPKSLGGTGKHDKPGRLLPTVLLIASDAYVKQHYDIGAWQVFDGYTGVRVLVGAAAQQLLEDERGDPIWNRAVVSSLKRRILKGEETISVNPAGMSRSVDIKCADIVAVFLKSLRMAATTYLQGQARKKHLNVPYSGSIPTLEVQHCCIGVPAAATISYKTMLRQAAISAGFAEVRLLTESTAAAMAYGLSLQRQDITKSKESHTILVFDMGGGTTDVTIASRNASDDSSDEYSVLKSIGDNALGGDDMDEALRLACQAPASELYQIRRAKIQLCNDESQTVHLSWNQKTMEVSKDVFEEAIQLLLKRVRCLVESASRGVGVDEVILVGGATRVPSVQRTLQELFPSIQLCRSVQPDSAVAQGCAVAAALEVLPRYELQSALMMDTNPHPIGVDTSNRRLDGSFVEILAAGAPLPARGSAIFTLANAKQPGVTLHAVEKVSDERFEKLGEFTFLLRKMKTCPEVRTVEISMILKESGEFIVSVFDEHDPEHLKKRNRDGLALQYNDSTSFEQNMLVVGCIFVFFLYLAVRISFPAEDLGLEK